MTILWCNLSFVPRGGSGVIAAVHLLNRLADRGCAVHVLTIDSDSLRALGPEDEQLASSLSPRVTIHRVHVGLVGSHGGASSGWRKLLLVLKNPKSLARPFLVPDPYIALLPRFLKRAKNVASAVKPDVVITVGYPWTIHVLGYCLKVSAAVRRWCAVYGDPWHTNPCSENRSGPLRSRLDRLLEARMLRSSDRVFMATPTARALYEDVYPFLSNRVGLLTLGFDRKLMEQTEPVRRNPDEVWLTYTGRLYSSARDIRPFINGLESLASAGRLPPRLRINLIGDTDASTLELISQSLVSSLFHIQGWVTEQESVAWMKASDWLLLFGNKGNLQIPGKVYQYVGTGRPTLFIREDPEDPSQEVLRSAQHMIGSDNTAAAIQSALLSVFAVAQTSRHEEELRERYNWNTIASDFLDKIREVTDTAVSRQ